MSRPERGRRAPVRPGDSPPRNGPPLGALLSAINNEPSLETASSSGPPSSQTQFYPSQQQLQGFQQQQQVAVQRGGNTTTPLFIPPSGQIPTGYMAPGHGYPMMNNAYGQHVPAYPAGYMPAWNGGQPMASNGMVPVSGNGVKVEGSTTTGSSTTSTTSSAATTTSVPALPRLRKVPDGTTGIGNNYSQAPYPGMQPYGAVVTTGDGMRTTVPQYANSPMARSNPMISVKGPFEGGPLDPRLKTRGGITKKGGNKMAVSAEQRAGYGNLTPNLKYKVSLEEYAVMTPEEISSLESLPPDEFAGLLKRASHRVSQRKSSQGRRARIDAAIAQVKVAQEAVQLWMRHPVLDNINVVQLLLDNVQILIDANDIKSKNPK